MSNSLFVLNSCNINVASYVNASQTIVSFNCANTLANVTQNLVANTTTFNLNTIAAVITVPSTNGINITMNGVSNTYTFNITSFGFSYNISVPFAQGTISFNGSGGGNGFLPAGHWMPQRQNMIQVYPRPDSETNINAFHHWAYYDGVNSITKRIPIGVSFGAFPFVYSLLSAPAGMSIGQTYSNSNCGVIFWTPQSVVTNSNVTILVTAQDGNTTTISFNVSTSNSTSHFIFLANGTTVGSDSTGNGTFGNPWQTLTKAFGSTFSATANPNTTCYLFSGTYFAPGYSDNDIEAGSFFEMNTTTKPIALVGLPGNTATINIASTDGCAVFHNGNDLVWQNLNPDGNNTTWDNFRCMWIAGGSGVDRMMFDQINWTNSGYGKSFGDNATMFHSVDGHGTLKNYLFINACRESGRQSASSTNNYAGCSLYSIQFSLVQGCVFDSLSTSIDGAWYLKSDPVDTEIRQCFARYAGAGSSGSPAHAFSMGQAADNQQTRVLCRYNTLVSTGWAMITPQQTNDGTVGAAWIERNTLTSTDAEFTVQTPNSNGPWVFANNVLQTSVGSPVPTGTAVQASNNQIASSGILDANGNLTGTTGNSYFGIYGAQIG
jgi:hypothetical protein